jgi:hypothetical protein
MRTPREWQQLHVAHPLYSAYCCLRQCSAALERTLRALKRHLRSADINILNYSFVYEYNYDGGHVIININGARTFGD